MKLFPPLSDEIESFAWPELFTMMICVGLKLPIADPFAVALVNVTGLKWASGRMPPLAAQHGASAMTSAEELAAPDRLAWTVWLQPRVVSDSTSV